MPPYQETAQLIVYLAIAIPRYGRLNFPFYDFSVLRSHASRTRPRLRADDAWSARLDELPSFLAIRLQWQEGQPVFTGWNCAQR